MIAVTDSTPSATTSAPVTTGNLNPEAPAYTPTTGLWTYTGKSVLLQTARATAFNPDHPSRTTQVRIVMDTGSQRSYVTDSTREGLALTVVGKQRMTITTFGANQGDNHVCDCVRVGLQLKNGKSLILTLFSVPIICEPLKAHPLIAYQEEYPHLSDLEFADDPGDAQPLHVYIVIGSDHF